MANHLPAMLYKLFFHQLEATQNFKWVKITHICLIWDLRFANIDVKRLILLPITVIWSANKMIIVASRDKLFNP